MKHNLKPDLPFSELPNGTVTFLFTGGEGPTWLLEDLGDDNTNLLVGRIIESVGTW